MTPKSVRHRRREGKATLHRDAHEGLPLDRKAGLHHRSFRALLARAVSADVGDGGVPEERDIERHRFFATTVEQQEGFDFFSHWSTKRPLSFSPCGSRWP